MAKVLVIDDESSIRHALGEILKVWGHEVSLAENFESGMHFLNDADLDVVLTDVFLPDGSGMDIVKSAKEQGLSVPIVMLTGHGTIEDAVEALHLGAENYLTKPVEPSRLKIVVEQALEKREMREQVRSLTSQLAKTGTMGGLKGRSQTMQEMYSLIQRVAPTEASVFITGESGTGKTLIAKTVHDYSRRRTKPFVAVNCAAIAPTLIESELFGHEKGAFTGATQQRKGYFEEAYGGTIFLDEITELPIELQGKLLRVLEENRIRRVGGNSEIKIDVRIVSASNRDPKQAIADGKLREDLYYRINIFPMHAAPLRERADDVPFLAQLFLEKLCEEENRKETMTMEPEVLHILKAYPWPGNVRELRNVINRAMIIARNNRISVDSLPDYIRKDIDVDELKALRNKSNLLTDEEWELAGEVPPETEGKKTNVAVKKRGKPTSDNIGPLPTGDMTLESMERVMIKKLLGDMDNNKPMVAEKLGISLKTLYNKIRKYDI